MAILPQTNSSRRSCDTTKIVVTIHLFNKMLSFQPKLTILTRYYTIVTIIFVQTCLDSSN